MVKIDFMESNTREYVHSSSSSGCFYIGRLVGSWQDELHSFSFTRKNDAVDSQGESKDAVSAGRVKETRDFGFYTAHNTQFYQQFDAELPMFSRKMADACGLLHPVLSMIRQDPGQVIPWHQDSFYKLRQKHNISHEHVLRYLIFLEEWKTGHYFQIADNPIVQWKKGDVYMIPPGQYHLSANCGLEPKLTAQISGLIGADSLHLRPPSDILI